MRLNVASRLGPLTNQKVGTGLEGCAASFLLAICTPNDGTVVALDAVKQKMTGAISLGKPEVIKPMRCCFLPMHGQRQRRRSA